MAQDGAQDIEKDGGHQADQQAGMVKLTKCVTIRNFDYEYVVECPSLLPPDKWLNCFDVTSQTRQALSTLSEWEGASHALLDIDIPNQQLYHLPMLITPVHCIYLVTFDLRNHKESLTWIHSAMKNVYALTSHQAKARGQDELPPKVLLVGMHADTELASDKRESFAKELNEKLQKMPYHSLVVKPGGDEPFWAVDGGDLSLSGTDPLSCAIQSNCSRHKAEVRQWIKCHRELQEKLKNVPCILYRDLKDKVAASASDAAKLKFDEFLQFLHRYGFIFYHSVEGGQDTDKVVLLQPQYLCKVFAEVPQLKKSRDRPTVADLLSCTAASMEYLAKHKQWFQRICIDMGLVFESVNGANSISDYIFLMGLDAGPNSPRHEFYSVPPLLVTFKASGHDQQEEERFLPSYYFAAFVSEFLRTLGEHISRQSEKKDQADLITVVSMEQHYLQVTFFSTYIHVVEREFCIEIGLQQMEVPTRKRRAIVVKKMQKLQSMCEDIRSIVAASVGAIQDRLKLAQTVLYGFYHERNEGESVDAFAEFKSGDEEPYLQCCCCKPPLHATTLSQEIWFVEDFDFDEVSIHTVTDENGCLIRQLVEESCDSNGHDTSTLSADISNGSPRTPSGPPVSSPKPKKLAFGTPSSPSPPSDPVQTKEGASSTAATPVSVSEFLNKHETEFFGVVNAKLSLLRLKRIGVITEDVLSHIKVATNKDAQEILYDHLIHHADLDTLQKYCDVAIEAEGHPKMQAFGKKMKEELQ